MSNLPPIDEWTVAKIASYIDRAGRLDDKALLRDINKSLMDRSLQLAALAHRLSVAEAALQEIVRDALKG